MDGKVIYEANDNNLVIKFNAEEITLETIVDYAFHNLKALDLKVSEISIEDVVKTILQEQEGNNNV